LSPSIHVSPPPRAPSAVQVILDNHMSTADWCCSESGEARHNNNCVLPRDQRPNFQVGAASYVCAVSADGNGLWYTDDWPEVCWALLRRDRPPYTNDHLDTTSQVATHFPPAMIIWVLQSTPPLIFRCGVPRFPAPSPPG
jgi:hypothetical protein